MAAVNHLQNWATTPKESWYRNLAKGFTLQDMKATNYTMSEIVCSTTTQHFTRGEFHIAISIATFLVTQAYFLRFLRNRLWKKLKNSVQENYCSHLLQKFFFAKKITKTPCVKKKLVFLLPKLNFFLENSMHRRLQAFSCLQKSVHTKSLCNIAL